MFNHWLTSSHSAVDAVMEKTLAAYMQQIAPARQQRMRDRDRQNLETTIRTVIANFAYATAINAEPPAIGISLRTAKQKLTRYDRKGFTGLPTILEALAAAGVLTLRRSAKKGIASQIIPGGTVVESWRCCRFGPEHFGEVKEPRESIVLSKTERNYVDGTVSREPIDYADTVESRRYRAEMQRINTSLAEADLRMEPDGGPPVLTSTHRHLCRHFKLPPGEDRQRFDLGGRLFGGWWQGVARERRHAIRINGEPIADLDFAAMFLRLAYLSAGATPPTGDLYAIIPGLSDSRWRDGVKKTVSAMLFRRSPLTKVPRDLREELPTGISGSRIRSAILAAHPALASVFETGIGLSLMFAESQILVAALLWLLDRRIPALPMHDGIMGPRSRAGAAKDAMSAASEYVTGISLPVVRKPPAELRPT
jgi:hypothetical protein